MDDWDHQRSQARFKEVIARKDPGGDYELPGWLVQPCVDL